MDKFDEFLRSLPIETETMDIPPLARHATADAVLVRGSSGAPFWRIMLAVLVGNLLTLAIAAVVLLVGIGHLLSDAAPAPATGPVSICYVDGC